MVCEKAGCGPCCILTKRGNRAQNNSEQHLVLARKRQIEDNCLLMLAAHKTTFQTRLHRYV